jgi:hypothetical protein
MTARPLLLLLALLLAAPSSLLAQPSSGTSSPAGDGEEEEPVPEVSTQGTQAAQTQEQADQAEEAEEAAPPAPTRDVWDRIIAVAGHLGIDTPFGIFGAAVEIAPVRYFTFYAGGGIGRSLHHFAGGIRGQYPVGNGAIGLSVGLAGGPLDWNSVAMQDRVITRRWDFALYLDWTLSAEYRFDEGFFLRAELGVESTLTNPDSCRFADGTACNGTDYIIPTRGWFGIAGGYAFDI